MKMDTLIFGADHRGVLLKEFLIKQCNNAGMHSVEDVGTFTLERTDYPLYVYKVIQLIKADPRKKGVLMCGSGIGMAIAANRFKGIYAGCIWSAAAAQAAKADDNINVIIFPVDFIEQQEAWQALQVWLSTPFKEGRYQERLELLEEYANEERE